MQKIAGYEVENFHLDVLEYARTTNEHFNAIETPVDMLINSLITLKNHHVIEEDTHYRIFGPDKTENGQVHISFHKDTVLSAYNRFFCSEPERKIRKNVFNNYLKTDPRVVRSSKTVKYNGKEHASVILNITDMEGLKDFSKIDGIKTMSAEELFNGNTNNK